MTTTTAPTRTLTCQMTWVDDGPHPGCAEFEPPVIRDCTDRATKVHVVMYRDQYPFDPDTGRPTPDVTVSVLVYCDHHSQEVATWDTDDPDVLSHTVNDLTTGGAR